MPQPFRPAHFYFPSAAYVLNFVCSHYNLELQDWKITDQIAGVENAGLQNDGRKG